MVSQAPTVVPESMPFLAYGKISYITSSEVIGGVTYATYRVETQIVSTGWSGDGYVCLIIPNTTSTRSEVWQENPTDPSSRSCFYVSIASGSKTVSGIVRVPVTTIVDLGCTTTFSGCPTYQKWGIGLFVQDGSLYRRVSGAILSS